MNNQTKKECCKGCQNGKPGENPACQAKLMVESMRNAQKLRQFKTYEDES